MAHGNGNGDPLTGYSRLLMQIGGWAVVGLFMYWLLPVFLENLIDSQKEIKAELVKVKENGAEQVNILRDIKEAVEGNEGPVITARKP